MVKWESEGERKKGESLSDVCPLSELNKNRERERGGRIKERRNCETEDLHANRQAAVK